MQEREQVIEGFRLSPQQKQIWELQKDGAAYHSQVAVLIEGDIESRALDEALKKIRQKHEILRTALDWLPGLDTPVQMILEDSGQPCRKIDLSDRSGEERDGALEELLREEARPFELKRGQLMRCCLVRLSASRRMLVISLHALCADSWTLRNLFREVSRFYAAELEGQELAEEAVQYLQFSEWQNQLLEKAGTETGDRGQEANRAAPALALPLESTPADDRKASHHRFPPEFTTLIFDPRTTGRIEAVSKALGSSVSDLLLACWQVLLWRLSLENEILTECLSDGRPFDELRDSLGLFAGYMPVQGIFGHSLRFDEAVERVNKSLGRAYDSREFFLPGMTGRTAMDRAHAIGFDYEEWPKAERAGEVTFTYWKQYCRIDRFKLKLAGYRQADGLKIELQYDPQVLSAESIELIREQYLTLIESATSQPAAQINDLEIIGPRERQRLLVEWNCTERALPSRRAIHELIGDRARLRPESIAVIYRDEQISYGELESRANRLANHLRSLGVGPESIVGLYLQRSTELVIGLLGILKAGGAYLPLQIGEPVERLRLMLEDARSRVVVTKQELAWSLPVGGYEKVCLDVDQARIAGASSRAPEVDICPENLAYLIYTSGSTGRPKAVMVKHGSVLNLLEGLKEAIYEGKEVEETITLNASVAFDASVKQVIKLSGGVRLCVVPEDERKDAEAMVEYVRSHGVAVLETTPSQLRVLKDSGLVERESAPRIVLVGGEAIDARRWKELSESAGVKYYNSYGPTECTVNATVSLVRGGEPTIGRPISNTRIYILSEEGRINPTGVEGEIYIGGLGVARGYLGEAGLTAEKFVPDQYGSGAGERLYRTGDIGRYRADGRIEYRRRRDGQVKLRGFRIELGEVEAALASHPNVGGAAVILREDEPGEKRLVGYAVARQGMMKPLLPDQHRSPNGLVIAHQSSLMGTGIYSQSAARRADPSLVEEKIIEERNGRLESVRTTELSMPELLQYLRERIPDYMIPAAIVIIDELPLNRNGKVDRGRLPKPEEVAREADGEEIQYRNAYEEILAGILKDLLKVERVKGADNFFEIGGHSLLATQVISRVRKTFGVEIGIRSIFEEPTVAGLARRIEGLMSAGERDDAPPLVRVSREERLPLSFAQQRLWFIEQLEPGRAVYNCPSPVRMEGPLNLGALEAAIGEIIRRHEVLRTRIVVEDGQPAQVIDSWRDWRLEVVDLTDGSPDQRENDAWRIAREEAETGFDLGLGPLLRVRILKLGPEDHIGLFTTHHIVSDGWSMGVLVREVCLIYEAINAGRRSPLPELEIQYADYAVWQRRYLAGGVLESEVEYWKAQLKDAAVLELPTDRPRLAAPTHRGGEESIRLGKEVSEELKRLSRREGATLFMVLMAAFKTLLMRHGGEEDLSVGTAIANRTRSEIEGLIGFFVNTLVMRTSLEGNPTFRELIGREREAALGAYAHQNAPFEKLVEEINPERDLSRSPLFQVMMVLQNTQREQLEIGGLQVSEIGEETTTAKFDLMMALSEGPDGIAGSLRYSRDLYDGETMRRVARRYEKVIAEIVRDPERRITEIEIISEAEKSQILVEFNRTRREYDGGRLIHELIEARADEVGDKTAVVDEWERVSYGELNRRANQLAGYLIKRGVGVEDRVGVCMNRGIEMIVGLLGILKAGAAYVPLDPTYPQERLEYMLTEAEVKTLVTRESLNDLFIGRREDRISIDSDWPTIARESVGNPGREMWERNLAYVIYTSGSTGKPKGAAITHHSAVTLLNWAGEAFSDEELNGVLASTSICFDLSVFELMAPLSRGGKVIVAENALRLPELKAAEEVKLINTVPSAIRELAGSGGIPDSAETVNLAGEALRNGLAQQVYEVGSVKRVLNLYGPTEDTTYSTWTVVAKGAEEEPSVGRPIANTEVYILDGGMRPTPIGVYGEIYIGGEGLARCYLNRPEITAEKFAPNPFGSVAGERVYRTGDIGRYGVDGEIEYFGRSDHQVKVRGYRIELGEIEGALEEDATVREAVVMAREDEGGDKRLVAYIVGEKGRVGEGEAKRLRKYLKEKLPDYMVPSAIVELEKMPLTPNGKLDRKALPSPERERGRGAGVEAAAQTPVEEIVIGIFEEVLKVDQAGRSDNFFEIGGHSLLATQAVSRMRDAFGVEIGVRSIFEEPTVAGLARRIEEAIKAGKQSAAPPLARTRRTGDGAARPPLSFAQQRLWFLDQLVPNNPMYNLLLAVKLEGRLNLEALERAINEVIRRHEVLRTRFELEGDQPVQVIEEWKPRRLEVVDLSDRDPKEAEAEAVRIAQEEAKTGFDLSRGPLLRVKILKLEEERHALVLTLHHIVSDAWSTGILVREMSLLYEAMSNGQESPLPELDIQYADYASWQRSYLKDEVLEEHLRYWKQQLSGKLPVVNLAGVLQPRARPAVRTYRGASKSIPLPAELSKSLKALSRQEGATLFMVLLAAFKTLLYRYTAQSDLMLGVSMGNRDRAEIEPLIGFFINMLPMRTDLSGNPRFTQLLKRVKEVALGTYAHQETPFEKLVEEIQPERALGQMPLFNIVFGVQNAPKEDARAPGLELSPMTADHESARFDLTLWINESAESIYGSWIYSVDLFEEETILRMHGHLETLLSSIVARPDAPLDELEMFSEAEKSQRTASRAVREKYHSNRFESVKPKAVAILDE